MQTALQAHIAVKQAALFAPTERKPQGEPFQIKPTDGPADIFGRHRFNEIGAWPGVQIGHHLFDGTQRQAGAGRKIYMPHAGKVAQHYGGGLLRGSDDAPSSPLAGMSSRKPDVRHIRKIGFQFGIAFAVHAGIDMHHHRTVANSPMPGNLGRAVQRSVAQHDEPDSHPSALMPSCPLTSAPEFQAAAS